MENRTVDNSTGLYTKFYNELRTCTPQVFRVGAGLKDWLNSGIKNVIKNAMFAPQGKKIKKAKKKK